MYYDGTDASESSVHHFNSEWHIELSLTQVVVYPELESLRAAPEADRLHVAVVHDHLHLGMLERMEEAELRSVLKKTNW
jgi:hypothetical protein